MEIGIPVDIWGNELTDLYKRKLFLFDMDGTIYEEELVFEGTKELLRLIEEIGGRYVFITNNSSKSVVDYIEKVNRLGIKADINNFFTSAQATVLYLRKNFEGKKVYCQGTKSLVQELRDNGIAVTEEVEYDVDVVVVGFDTELTSAKLRKTCELLQRDIPYIATNPDFRCPVSFGFIPDCGSICNMIEAATSRKPLYIGKPEPTMVDIVREKFGYKADETVVIGDRLYTDIATGLNAGVMAICVLTGEATKEEIQNGNIKPTLTFDSILNIFWVLAQFKIMGGYKRVYEGEDIHPVSV
ncbi:HAD-IIA family hydrolase [Lachnoclostridium pacaense]|uniref:HAD-IIA family hydrolase n=1 Tax=Enterocloster hominis (ex Hitch et al. 2024) TaxID=1917870 RepID=UPI001D1223E9|nr:HAD-IIA family hydrolase [Lachnoclostridium pacaense]MCC2820953.1 HAD-IIA family hydrolase [Lachnoclostridium pacaense]